MINVCLFLAAGAKICENLQKPPLSQGEMIVESEVDYAEVNTAGAVIEINNEMEDDTQILKDNSKHRCLDDVVPSFNSWPKVLYIIIVWT